jgi:hypothetical protein
MVALLHQKPEFAEQFLTYLPSWKIRMETNLRGAFERGLKGRVAGFDIAADVFDQDDRIIDYEAR